MEIVEVDPRDVRWEDDLPEYRVTLWSSGGAASWEYLIAGADGVRAVLDWLKQQTRPEGRHADHVAEVFIVARCREDGLGLLRLGGQRPREGSCTA